MTIEKKTIRSDIPGSHVFLNNSISYAGSTNEESRRLVVSRDISLQGQIGTCEHLVIEGAVQNDAFTARRLDILESGLFSGTAEVQDCVIAGKFEGKLMVRGRLTVKSTGQVYGQIEYSAIEAENGARIEGQMSHVAPAVTETKIAEIPAKVETIYSNDDLEADERSNRASNYRRAAGF